MNRGLVGILIVAGLLAAAYVYWLLHKRPIGQQDVVSVVLSVDDKGNCVQSGAKNGVVTINEGQQIEYSADQKVPFNVNFGPAGVISTGSPFPSAAGAGWQMQFNSGDGSPASTMPSKLTFPEWLLRAFGATNFPYQSVTINGNPCILPGGGGIHIEP